jgi:hypothetical protein
VNGHVRANVKVPDDFEPSSRLNSRYDQIAVTTVAPGCEIVTYSAAEAYRYAEAFLCAAEMLEQQATGGAR